MRLLQFAFVISIFLFGSLFCLHGQDARAYQREFAQIRADMKILQEDQLRLLNMINTLREEKKETDESLRQLSKVVQAYEGRLQGVERDLLAKLDALRQLLNEEKTARRKELTAAIDAMAAEIGKLDRVATEAKSAADAASKAAARKSGKDSSEKTPVNYTGTYREFEVQKGDTLGKIAEAAGVSVSMIREVNGLKNDTIRVGQKLKIPEVKK